VRLSLSLLLGHSSDCRFKKERRAKLPSVKLIGGGGGGGGGGGRRLFLLLMPLTTEEAVKNHGSRGIIISFMCWAGKRD
jgi:hypothetical protein